jgi:hypothetical protein
MLPPRGHPLALTDRSRGTYPFFEPVVFDEPAQTACPEQLITTRSARHRFDDVARLLGQVQDQIPFALGAAAVGRQPFQEHHLRRIGRDELSVLVQLAQLGPA